MKIIKWYRVERWCYLHHLVIIAKIIKILIRVLWGAVIPYQVEIGEGTQFTYQALGVVLYRKTVIGSNCIIRQHVTIALGDDPDGIPTIGNNVDIGAGTVIWGGVKIGNNVRIGANSFVNKDIPSNCTAVGAPCRLVKFTGISE